MNALIRSVVAVSLGMGFFACAHKSKYSEAPRAAVERMLKLYQDDRARFVRHLEDYEKSGECDYVKSLASEAEKMDFDGAVPKDSQQALVVVKMELAEADKICRQ